MLKDVFVSKRLQKRGIIENHRGFPQKKNIRVFGADTETVHGQIYCFQAVSCGEETLTYCKPEDAFKRLMAWIMPRTIDKGINLVFFHNLRFDLTVLFSQDHQNIYDQYNDIRLERDGYVIQMFFGRVNFVRVWPDLGGYLCQTCGSIPKEAVKHFSLQKVCGNPKHGAPVPVRRNLGTPVRWTDSAAFCPPGAKSLDAALKIYGVPYQKMKAPEGLGERELKGPEFETYALNDARAEEALGLAILDLHREYDITPCISLPQLSARILRHHFFRKGESFPFPPEECQKAAELSYHAGKNGFYCKPGAYENLYEYDINSAFPKAMLEMPQMVKGAYRHVKTYKSGVMGIYRVSGKRLGGKYPLCFDASFRPHVGAFKECWITGYEYQYLKRSKDYRVTLHEGWIWDHDKTYRHSPLAEFVKRFWHLKNTTPKGPKRDTYKNILNSLYGKFAACVEKREKLLTGEGLITLSGPTLRQFTAGALYHPFIATQITGYVRAELYKLETSGQALHAATDSIKSFLDFPSTDGLGGIKKEVFGRCYLFRNKLYLHFARDTRLCGHDLEKGWLYVSQEDRSRLGEVGEERRTGYCYDQTRDRFMGKLFEPDGQHLCKVGLHGFKGSSFLLYRNRERLFRDGFLDYDHAHMTNLREAILRKERPADMVRRKERLLLSSPKEAKLSLV